MLNEAALRWLNDHSAHGILITDADLTIRGWNHWLEGRSGFGAGEMVGRNLLEAYPDLITRGLDQYYLDVLAGQVRLLAHRFHRYLFDMPAVVGEHSFTKMQQSARIAPLVEDGRVIGTITVIEDVTERVAREERLVELLAREQAARKDAEQANRAKDEFLATVSHELRTPLNAIYGWIQIMRRGEIDQRYFVRGLETVERNILMQAKLIEDILDVSRIITGKLNLDVNTIELTAIIEAAIDSARPAADAKGIRLRANLDRNAGAVLGDPNRLQQVVWNLVSNAIKFTPKGGSVDVSLARVDSQVEISVSDTGQGISPEFLPFVFDRFRQADSTSTRRHGGLGLGLAIVRHLVEMHGGTVQAASGGEGRGATFFVKLPVTTVQKAGAQSAVGGDIAARSAAAPAAKDGPYQGATQNLDGLRVLIIDDEADTRETLNLMLTRCGAEVMASDSVRGALETIEQWGPDVLVSDIGMPVEDGFTLISQVRTLESRLGRPIPAVALTGYARPEDRSRVLEAGYRVHLSKPVKLSELADAVACLARETRKGLPTSAE